MPSSEPIDSRNSLAHKIRNRSSKVFQATSEIHAQNRWCLTGTPIQNSLEDFGSLIAFIGVPPFGTRDQFRFWISSPILHTRQSSLQILRKLVRATCLRRTKALPHLSSGLNLPRKTERVEVLELAPDERELYDFFKRRSYLLFDKVSESGAESNMASKSDARAETQRQRRVAVEDIPDLTRRKGAGNIIVLISVLRMICDHGEALLPRVALDAWRSRDAGAVSWAVMETAAKAESSCCACGQSIDGNGDEQESDMSGPSCKDKHIAREACVTTADCPPTAPECPKRSAANHLPSASASPRKDATQASRTSPSSKVSAIIRNVLSQLQSRDTVGKADGPVKRYVPLRDQLLLKSDTLLVTLIYMLLNGYLHLGEWFTVSSFQTGQACWT